MTVLLVAAAAILVAIVLAAIGVHLLAPHLEGDYEDQLAEREARERRERRMHLGLPPE